MENSCQYGGQTYSEGATICSNGKELICSGGIWSPTGAQCNMSTLNSSAVIFVPKSVKTEPFDENQYSQTAVAFTDTNLQSAVPFVTISKSDIRTIWKIVGGGKIISTFLNGKSQYHLPQGPNKVQPGGYSLQIDGAIVSTGQYGRIEITLYYD